jgi:CHAD domain-containing protein
MLYGLKDISEWISGWSEEPNDDSRLSRNAVNKYEEWIRAIDNGLKTIDMNELSEIHALRLLIKKARYVQVRIKYFSNHKKWSASKLKDKQNDLGKLCDILNNVSLIRNLNSFEDRDSLEFEKGYLLGYQEFEKQMLVERHSEK